jgi:hypothetical protein
MAPDAGSTTEGRCHHDDHTPHDAPLLLVVDMRCRRRSMPDVGRRRKPTDALGRHSLVGFPPGDSVQPGKSNVGAPIYVFGSALMGAATTSPYPRPSETHASAAEDNIPRIRRQVLVPHSVSQNTFARTSAPARARPCSFPPSCVEDEDDFEQGILYSAMMDHLTFKVQQCACLHDASGLTSP